MTLKTKAGVALAVVCLGAGLAYYFSDSPEKTSTDPVEDIRESPDLPRASVVVSSDQATVEVPPEQQSEPDRSPRATPPDERYDPLAPAERESFVATYDLPDGISFVHVALMIQALQADQDDTEYMWLEHELEISREEAELIVSTVLDAKKQSDAAIEQVTFDTLCNGETQKLYGDELYPVLEDLEDMRASIPENHLHQAYETLGEPLAEKLAQVVHERKLGISYAKHDQKSAFEIMAMNVDENVAGICVDLGKKY